MTRRLRVTFAAFVSLTLLVAAAAPVAAHHIDEDCEKDEGREHCQTAAVGFADALVDRVSHLLDSFERAGWAPFVPADDGALRAP